MFGLLKKKISGFVEKLGKKKEETFGPPKEELVLEPEKKALEKKEEKEVPQKKEAPKAKEIPEKKKEKSPEEKKEVPKPEKTAPEKKTVPEEKPPAKEEKEPAPVKKEALIVPAKEEKQVAPEKEKKAPAPQEPVKKEDAPAEKKKGFLEKILGPKKKEEPKKEEKEQVKEEKEPEAYPQGEIEKEPELKKEDAAKKREEELRKKVKKGLFAAVAETVTGESEIKENEVVELLEELELGMLESDVALSVAEEIKESLRKKIVGSKVKRGQTAAFVKESLREILVGMFRENSGFELQEKIAGKEKPYKIMVVGPNGAGKTTTIAKLVALLQKEGHSVCVAASDTFRAAAVEQLVYHGNKLGIKVVHGTYGADPTSIAFDAVNYAKANKIDVVLIDTAGRQETNINLINQLKKMDRVIAPDLRIYVGESIAGNAMVEQVSRFNADVGLDGVILTKLDCDAKGGTVISVSGVAKLPILYVGVGQGYGDLKKFVAEEIVEEILS